MQFSHHSQEVVFLNHHHSQVAMGNVVFPYHLFAIFILIPPFFLPCLFVSLMFLFKASNDTPRPLPPSRRLPTPPPPRRPRAVRMICKLQKTKSPSLVSTAHLGNSISQGGQALQRTASPSCSLRPCSSEWSLCGLSATHVSLWRRELPLSK